MSEPSAGPLTFLFTDIEGSTRLWEEHPEAMGTALAQHDALLRTCIQSRGGCVFKTMGDAFCAVFTNPREAVEAALAAQFSLPTAALVTAEARLPLRVRMALHTGLVEERDGDYFGRPLNRVARLLAAGHGGQVLLSAAVQELVRDDLPDGAALQSLGEHRLKDLGRPEVLFQLRHPELAADFPPLRSLCHPELKHNLPQQVTSFVGREAQLIEVKGLLERTRLLTLMGAGGSGKTRLGLQLGADLLEQFPEGVWLVELGALTEPGLVPQAVAEVLGVQEEAGRPLLTSLTEALQPCRLLLLLDNCEHLIAACAQLAESLLRRCPHVVLLATSRERLGIAGEVTYRVPSLSLPDPQRHRTPSLLSPFEAAQLFIERAQVHQPQFAVTNENAPALASICCRLDGIPLAIELAAARVRVMPVEQIERRLDERFRLLTGGSRTALPRQQTLRSLIDWSYDLLSEPEQTLLQRLSVFAGGWSLEAAEVVCSGESVEAWETLDLVTALVDKSLVLCVEAGDTARYSLLETVRRYAQDRLRESGDALLRQDRHATHFLALAQEARPHLTGADQPRWLRLLEQEHDNLRAALTFLHRDEAHDAEAVHLTQALSWFWYLRGHWSEGRRRLEEALERAAGLPPEVQGRTAYSAACLAHAQSDYDAALGLYQLSLKHARTGGDEAWIAWILGNQAAIALERGDADSAVLLAQESLALFRHLGDAAGTAALLRVLGDVSMLREDYPVARIYVIESLGLLERLDDRAGAATLTLTLGALALKERNPDQAQGHLQDALRLSRETGLKSRLPDILATCAEFCLTRGSPGRAASLLGAAEGLRRELGATLLPANQTEYDRVVGAVRDALTPAALDAAWQSGMARTSEEAIADALDALAPAG